MANPGLIAIKLRTFKKGDVCIISFWDDKKNFSISRDCVIQSLTYDMFDEPNELTFLTKSKKLYTVTVNQINEINKQ